MFQDSNYDAIKSSMEYKKLHKLLDCYGYLRIYSIWGTKNIGQLAEQEELYEYIKELWLDFQVQKDTKGRKRLTDIGQVHLKEALNTIKSELTSYLDKGRKEFKTEFLHKVIDSMHTLKELEFP